MDDKPKLLNAGKRPYYDPSVLANKRATERSAILEAFKAAFGFGTALIVNTNKSITLRTPREKRDQKKR